MAKAISIYEIHVPALYPRSIKKDKLREIEQSIAELGQVQPVRVLLALPDVYLLIDGWYRFRAMVNLGYPMVLATVKE